MKKIALIGYGYWGPNLLRNFMEVPCCEVVYCCDKDVNRLKEVRKRYPSLIITRDYEDLLHDSELDAAIIATPTKFHYQVARDFLRAGKDVLIEKPMTLTSKEAGLLVEIARKQKKIIMVDHTFIYNEAVRKIKEVIKSGSLGDILYLDSVRANLGLFQQDSNVIFDLATHDFSIVQYLLEDTPVWLQAFGKSHYNKQEDVAYIIAQYAKNISVHIQVSWLSPLKVRQLLIVGTKKMLVYDDVNSAEKIRIYEKGVDLVPGLTTKLEEAKVSYRSGDAWLPNIKGTEALSLVAREFIEAILTRRKPISDGLMGLNVVSALEKATESARSGKKIFFKNANKK
jgi:predicted dehydrogenase